MSAGVGSVFLLAISAMEKRAQLGSPKVERVSKHLQKDILTSRLTLPSLWNLGTAPGSG